MNLSTWSIRSPIPSLLLFVLFTLLGLMTFRAMKIQNFPDLDLPTVIVTASLPGAAPSQLETEVARRIENSLASITGLKHIYTKIQDGVATITAEFRLEKPVAEAVDDVRAAVSRVRSDLPQDLREPIVAKLELSGLPVLTYSIASDRMDEESLSWFVDNEVAKSMLAVAGVGRVARVGGVTREIHVDLNPDRMLGLGVTAAEISRRIRQVQQESSGGRATIGGSEQSIRTVGTVQTAADLARLEIPLVDGRRIRLDQVAKVSDTIAERRSAALLDGRQVVGFEISRSRGESEVAVARGVRAKLAELVAAHPGIIVDEAFNFVDPVEENYVGSLNLLFEGAILAVLVVFLFLRDWRATFVAAVALPLSILPTFAAMYFMGFTINVISLLALSLSYAGYEGEVMRGAFASVPRGQIEAARAMGMPRRKIFSRVSLPLALQSVLPTLGGEAVLQLKATPLVATITVIEIYAVASRVRQDTLITYEPLFLVAAIYLVLAGLIVLAFRRMEGRQPRRTA